MHCNVFIFSSLPGQLVQKSTDCSDIILVIEKRFNEKLENTALSEQLKNRKNRGKIDSSNTFT